MVNLSFGDLFRYRRALRTALGEIRKLALHNQEDSPAKRPK
jgi:hypothetical protein